MNAMSSSFHYMHFVIITSCVVKLLLSLQVAFVLAAGAGRNNPYTPKSKVIRYWNSKISNDLPKPWFLIDKVSPLTAADYAMFSKLAGNWSLLSDHLTDFCQKANLYCLLDSHNSMAADVDNFAKYGSKNFSNYGTGRLGEANTFKTYSHKSVENLNSFRRYSRDSIAHDESFDMYAGRQNMPIQGFNGYGKGSVSGAGEFSGYNEEVNVPNLQFAAYSAGTEGRMQTFKEYATGGNSGSESFKGYGKGSDGAENQFTRYATNSNVIASNFKNYAQLGNGGNDTFSSYGADTNVPQNTFHSYAAGSNGAGVEFNSYRTKSTSGNDEFQSYGKQSNGANLDFKNYADESQSGTSEFTGYGQNASGQSVDFTRYGPDRKFNQYADNGVSFSQYINHSSGVGSSSSVKGKTVNSWVVEPGKFFREKMLKNGTIMPMPDIRDTMPERSFLPRAIASKLPFSTSKLTDLQNIFHADGNSEMAKMLKKSLKECECAPSDPSETKRCVVSIEDMIDFAISILGQNITVRTTENTQGYNSNIMIGRVKGIDGGKATKSVSCHESLFPYMVYYCHSVPKVRVYEVEILDPKSRAGINYGVAICHLDTKSWSPNHGAFLALGPGPGKIEVCHWIFENDMTWTVAV